MLARERLRVILLLTTMAIAWSWPVPMSGQGTAGDFPQERLWDEAMVGDTAVLAKAVRDGAAIDSLDTRRNPNGRRALNWAAWYNRPEAIRFLFRHGATVNLANQTGFTPLHHAAENGSLEAAETLLELGADRTLRNNAGETPVYVALTRGHGDAAAAIEGAPRRRP